MKFKTMWAVLVATAVMGIGAIPAEAVIASRTDCVSPRLGLTYTEWTDISSGAAPPIGAPPEHFSAWKQAGVTLAGGDVRVRGTKPLENLEGPAGSDTIYALKVEARQANGDWVTVWLVCDRFQSHGPFPPSMPPHRP